MRQEVGRQGLHLLALSFISSSVYSNELEVRFRCQVVTTYTVETLEECDRVWLCSGDFLQDVPVFDDASPLELEVINDGHRDVVGKKLCLVVHDPVSLATENGQMACLNSAGEPVLEELDSEVTPLLSERVVLLVFARWSIREYLLSSVHIRSDTNPGTYRSKEVWTSCLKMNKFA